MQAAPVLQHIQSTANPLVKQVRQLHSASGRRSAVQFLVEGRRAIDGFIAQGWQPDLIMVVDDQAIPAQWPESVLCTASSKVIQRCSQSTTPSGFVARFAVPGEKQIEPQQSSLILHHVADPGNVGTLMRSAVAFGYDQVVLVGGCDPWQHKVVQASVGALARLRVVRYAEDTAAEDFVNLGCSLVALTPRDGLAPQELGNGSWHVVVGSEAHGLPESWISAAQHRCTLPMQAGSESLNAAVSGSIVAYLLAGC